MNKPTSGPWFDDEGCVYNPARLKVADCNCRGMAHENAALIVAAVNACFAINPSNPLAVAEALPELAEACRKAQAFLSELSGNGVAHVHIGPAIGILGAALAKLEAKS
jgi:hypothetical protein